jgi:uncharacterized protein YcsI (UPF0317 family)
VNDLTELSTPQLRDASAAELRSAIRLRQFRGQTAGLAKGMLQANLAIVPESHALDFMRFCQRNPKPCPLVGVSDTGSPYIKTLSADIDIRTDVPMYNIYRDGALTDSVYDISDVWQSDFVVFAMGCSFTFEHALIRAGIPLWHYQEQKTVPMYRSSIMTRQAGVFAGEMVVTMRAIPADRVAEAEAISARYPLAHGSPVHIGDADSIGIADLYRPDWGDPPPATGSDVPVFWACGVTPQNALLRARLPLSITHKPGHMLVTDVSEQAQIPIVE